MPTLSSMKIPPPKSWEEFEELPLDSILEIATSFYETTMGA